MTFTVLVLDGMLDDIDVLATHASIHTADPGGSGAHEVSGGSYVRKALTWPAASSGIKTAGAVTFQIPTGVTITHFGLWSAVSGGSFLGGQALAAPVEFALGGPYSLTVSAVTDAPSAVPSAGGTMTGPLRINTTGNTDPNLPLGRTGSADTGIDLIGSFLGGEDESGGTDFDSTARINFYNYQRAESTSYSEQLRFFGMTGNTKGIVSWYKPRLGYDSGLNPVGSLWDPCAWIVGHVMSNDDSTNAHNHLSFEIPDSTGAVQTRFELPFGLQGVGVDQTIRGLDHTNLKTNLCDFTVRAAGSTAYSGGRVGILRVAGGGSVEKIFEFGKDADSLNPTATRWRVVCNTDAESTGDAGANLVIRRFSDAGSQTGTAMFFRRSDGNVAFGQASAELARVAAIWGTSGTHGFYAKPSSTPGSAAAFAANLTVVGDRLLDNKVTTDTNSRIVIFGDGKLEWGSGSTGRDTNLYRSAADVLTTDDSLTVGASLTVTTATTSPTVRGSTSASGTLTLSSTSNATKGKVLIGTSAYDEVNNRLGIGNSTPGVALDVTGQITASTIAQAPTLQGGTGSAGTLTLVSTSNATKGKILMGTSAYDEANNRLGIGTASPTVPLDVTGNAAISGTLTLGGDATLTRSAAGVFTTTAELWRTTASAFTGAYLAQVTGDAVPRLNIMGDGKTEWGDGTSARDVNLYRSAADTLKTDDTIHVAIDLKLVTAGSGLYVKEGTNASMGAATLVAGTVVVSTTKVTANSRIFAMGQNASGTAGFLSISARTAGTSFTILSSSGTDTRSVAWWIVEPA